MTVPLVVDASAAVDLLLNNDTGYEVATRLRGHTLAAPAHLDAEVVSAFARLVRGGDLTDEAADRCVDSFVKMPIERYPTQPLLVEAWLLRHSLRVLDSLYVALAHRLDSVVVTTDLGMAGHPRAELVRGPQVPKRGVKPE